MSIAGMVEGAEAHMVRQTCSPADFFRKCRGNTLIVHVMSVSGQSFLCIFIIPVARITWAHCRRRG